MQGAEKLLVAGGRVVVPTEGTSTTTEMLRSLVFALCLACAAAFAPASVAMSQVSASRVGEATMMARAPPKRKAAPKKAAKKAAPRGGTAQEGKGGILPWVTNSPGTYAKPLLLSSIDFTGDEGDAWVGWGFMPKSVKALYPKGYKGGFYKAK